MAVTITQIGGSDFIKDSRTIINTNFTNLKNAVESSQGASSASPVVISYPSTAAFTWQNQGTATVSGGTGSPLLLTAAASASDSLKILEQNFPSTPWTIYVSLDIGFNNSNYAWGGICVRDSSNGKVISWGYSFQNSFILSYDKWTNVTTYSAQTTLLTHNNPFSTFKLAYDGVNFTFSASYDGVNFIQLQQISKTDFLTTPDKVGIFANSRNSQPVYVNVWNWSTTNTGNITLSQGSIGCVATRTTSFSVNNTTDTAIVFDNTVRDDASFHSGATYSRLTVPESGWYFIAASVDWDTNSSGRRFVHIRVDGTDWQFSNGASAMNDNRVPVSGSAYLSAGQYIEIIVYQDSGGIRSIDTARLSVVRMGTSPGVPTIGAIASKPSTPIAGQIYYPTDSVYNLIRYNGTSWDYFKDGRKVTVPPTNISWVNQNSATWSTTYDYGKLTVVQVNGTGGTLAYVTVPAAPYTFIIKYRINPAAYVNYFNCGGALYTSGSGKVISMGPAYANGVMTYRMGKWSDFTTLSSSTDVPMFGHFGMEFCVRLQDNSTNIVVDYSSDSGLNWTNILSETRATFLGTPTGLGFFYHKNNATGSDIVTITEWSVT